MAQHILINRLSQKVFKKIERAIIKDFKREDIKGSLKYNFNKELSNFYKRDESEEVYFANRNIGKGFVYGSIRGDFEIHFNKDKKEINQIYLVA